MKRAAPKRAAFSFSLIYKRENKRETQNNEREQITFQTKTGAE